MSKQVSALDPKVAEIYRQAKTQSQAETLSVTVPRGTYRRLKDFCSAHGI